MQAVDRPAVSITPDNSTQTSLKMWRRATLGLQCEYPLRPRRMFGGEALLEVWRMFWFDVMKVSYMINDLNITFKMTYPRGPGQEVQSGKRQEQMNWIQSGWWSEPLAPYTDGNSGSMPKSLATRPKNKYSRSPHVSAIIDCNEVLLCHYCG